MKMMAVPLMIFSGATLANQTIELYKSETCGCCSEWADIMEEKGYQVNVHHKPQWNDVRSSFSMPSQLQSCHTAIIDGYLIEGHVPESDIARLLEERPDNIKGLAAPGMPMHSPGMAQPGEQYKDFKVIAFSAEQMTVYSEY
jgi:hypothetical protein